MITLDRTNVMGAPGVDTEARLWSCESVVDNFRLETCSFDDGVETDEVDEELEDEELRGM